MSGYVDHAWRHRPKALGGTDPVDTGLAPIVTAFLSKSSSTVNVATPWADQNNYIAWTTHTLTGTNAASYFEYIANIGDGNPGMIIKQGGIYQFDWSVWVEPTSLATTNTGRLVPPYLQYNPIYAPDGEGSFTGVIFHVGMVKNWANCTSDWGVNERSIKNSNSTLPPALGGQEILSLSMTDSLLPYTATCRFQAYDGAHDYKWYTPLLQITRWGDYV